MLLEKTLKSHLDSKEIKWVNPTGNQPWIFIERPDAEAEAPVLWPPGEKNQLIGKNPDTGKDWRQEEKGKTEDEMVGWHHRLNGHEFEQAPGVGNGQGSLVSCSPWGHKEADTTEQLNWTEAVYIKHIQNFLLAVTTLWLREIKSHSEPDRKPLQVTELKSDMIPISI